MNYSDEINSTVIKNCPIHIVYKLETVCCHPNCEDQRMMCRVCFVESNSHVVLHKNFIIKISTIIEELSNLINQRFYEKNHSQYVQKDYINRFTQILEDDYSHFENMLDQYLEQITQAVKKKKADVRKIIDDEIDVFTDMINSFGICLSNGMKYEQNLCKMEVEFKELLGDLKNSENINDYIDYEQFIINFSRNLCHNMNTKQSFKEERVKQQISDLMAKFDLTLVNPPKIVIGEKIFDTVNTIENKVQVENLADEILQQEAVASLNDFETKNIEIFPNYFYGINAFQHLYQLSDNKVQYVKLPEVEMHPKIHTLKIQNHQSTLKDIVLPSLQPLPDGRLFFIGGFNMKKLKTVGSIFELNFQTDNLVEYTPMNSHRYYFGSAITANKIFVIGGLQANKGHSNSIETCEYYDIENDQWFAISPLNTPCHHSAVCHFNHEYIMKIGGYNGSSLLNGIEKYSIQKNKWEVLSVKNSECLQFLVQGEALQVNDDQIMIFGGINKVNGKSMPGMTFFLEVRNQYVDDFDYSIEEGWEFSTAEDKKMDKIQIFGPSKRSVIYDFKVYSFSNSLHLSRFDGNSWKVVA